MILGVRGRFLKPRHEPAVTFAPVGQPAQPARTAVESRSCLDEEKRQISGTGKRHATKSQKCVDHQKDADFDPRQHAGASAPAMRCSSARARLRLSGIDRARRLGYDQIECSTERQDGRPNDERTLRLTGRLAPQPCHGGLRSHSDYRIRARTTRPPSEAVFTCGLNCFATAIARPASFRWSTRLGCAPEL